MLVDGDQIAYTCAAMAENRYIRVSHTPTGITKSFPNRTNFKEQMDAKGKVITSDYTIEDIQEAESPAFCFKVIRQKIENLKRDTKADISEIYTGDSNNFRLDLPLPVKDLDKPEESQYKGQRSKTIRPLLLQDSKHYIRTSLGGKSVDGFEVDDMLSIRAYEELAKGNTPIIASFDKDTYQSDGCCIYNFGEDKPKVYLIPELGSLKYVGPYAKGDGYRFFCYQWLAGDPVDNYCGYRASKVRSGPQTVVKLLSPAKSVKELLEIVVKTYKLWYPSEFEYVSWTGEIIKADYKYMMDMYFKLAWMKRSLNDKSDYRELFNKYGVEYE